MAITVIIDNHVIDQRILILIGYDDINNTEEVWDTVHPIASVLLKAKITDRLLTWAELEPCHYQLLIKKQLEVFIDLLPEEQQDVNHKVVNTLRFLFCAYVRKISELTGSDVDVIRIQRIGPSDFSMNISLNIIMTTGKKPLCDKPDFKIIVDNTKEKE